MILNQRIRLNGTKQERIIQALHMAGWQSERPINLSNIEKYYTEKGIELFQSAKDFFTEYSGMASKWYIEVDNFNRAADFTFELFPYPPSYQREVRDYMFDDPKYEVYSTDYQAVLDLAHEKVILVGEIGYYYPACVWIGESAKLYATHDYDEQVLVFQSLPELISHELLSHDMTSVALKL